MSLVSEAGSKRSLDAKPARIWLLPTSNNTYERAAMGGAGMSETMLGASMEVWALAKDDNAEKSSAAADEAMACREREKLKAIMNGQTLWFDKYG